MKKLIIIVLLTFFFVSFAYADRWCEWSGTVGENCKNDRNGVVYLPFPTSTESIINNAGLYRVTITQPTIGVNQVRDAEVWGFADNQITQTWTVRDLTAQEILERDAREMSLTDYLQWNALVAGGVFTSEQIVTYLTVNYPEIVVAYLARKTLLEQ